MLRIWLTWAAKRILENIFAPPPPAASKRIDYPARNQEIGSRHAAGERVSDLARAYGISQQRISQIIHYQNG